MHKTTLIAAFVGIVTSVRAISPGPILKRDIITPLPQSADEQELKFQPGLDYDSDGCYNTAAIDPNGKTNPGKAATKRVEGECRSQAQLDNSNAYSRKRCNNGYCAIMYEYYFEKDQAIGGSFLGGHRHDWENIVVFVKGNSIVRVAPSCHGDYKNAKNTFPIQGNHPLLVYHKDGWGTHCFRHANDDDQLHIENPLGVWFRSPLVGWNSWPSNDLRSKMIAAYNDAATPKLPDDRFGNSLKEAAGSSVPGFDPYLDE